MKGDFSRQTFEVRNHYRAVLLQQGRVLLDADWNEQADIADHRDVATSQDVLGQHAGPVEAAAMGIVGADGKTPAKHTAADDLRITAGRYYVDGILCENEELCPLGDQPDLPGVTLAQRDAGRYVAYLDVWAEHLTAVERPELREVALGGPDTTSRSRTIWQLMLDRADADTTCGTWKPPQAVSPAQLRARASAPQDAGLLPCAVPATAAYRRLENQLYRVEVYDGSNAKGGATYVWSRENGSVVSPLASLAGDVLTLGAPPRDEPLGYTKDDWVEVLDLDRSRRGERGYLGRVDRVDRVELTVTDWRDDKAPTMADLQTAPTVRRWDSPGAVPLSESRDAWLDLEGGVQIQFEPGGWYRAGDYWLIPARTANLEGVLADPDLAGNVEWPHDEDGVPLPQPPVGVEHHYAPVALLDRDGEGTWTLAQDCRNLFHPLRNQSELLYVGGDGQEALPEEAVAQPLRVAVSSTEGAAEGASVHFTADQGGKLAAAAADLPASLVSEIDVTTGADGVAQCFWRPGDDPRRPSQQVTATYGGSSIHFSGQLSLAAQVAFDPGACAGLAGATTVQDALDRMLAAPSLVALGGNGQVGQPGVKLPLPVQVLVRSDCGPVSGARVRFSVTSGATSTAEVATADDGVAGCTWTLAPQDPVQQLTAELVTDGVQVGEPAKLTFTANLAADTHSRGIHVTGVRLLSRDADLVNDSDVGVDDLQGNQDRPGGLSLLLDGKPAPQTVNGKPVLRLTLDLPYPFSDSERQLWGDDPPVFGTVPLALDGTVALRDVGGQTAIIWSPSEAANDFLGRLLTMMAEFHRGDRVLCHIALTGRAVADENGTVVNGLALPRAAANGTEIVLPTVDDVYGAGFTMWFWLTPSAK